MAFSYRNFFLARQKFCCCLPVRLGVIIMSFLGILLSGVLSIALWFEVSNPDVAGEDRAPFIIAGLLQTFLFVASILGFVGTVVRKQSFVQAYAYFLYGHLLFNIAVAAYFLWVVTHFSQTAAYRGCVDSIRSSESEDQCVDLLKVVKGLYIAASTIVILIEGYGAIIVARYVNQIKGEKRVTRHLRTLAEENELGLRVRSKHSAAALDGADRGLLHPAGREFDPYADAPRGAHSTESADTSDIGPPAEVGYGGGSWTMQEISYEEKARLGRDQPEPHIQEHSPSGDEETRHEGGIMKLIPDPPLLTRTPSDDLPRYPLADRPGPAAQPQ